MSKPPVKIRDLAAGLWLWRQPHPAWRGQPDWEPEVASWAVSSRGVRLLLDPLLPPPSARTVWERLDAFDPEAVVILKPDHVRDVDLVVRWYGARALGPVLYWRDDVPGTVLEPVFPGDELPGGLLALDDGRGMQETPLYLPEQRALVFADGLTAPGGELRVWASARHRTRALPALRELLELLELPFEHVLVSHGEPVHTRADFEAALERPPHAQPEGR